MTVPVIFHVCKTRYPIYNVMSAFGISLSLINTCNSWRSSNYSHNTSQNRRPQGLLLHENGVIPRLGLDRCTITGSDRLSVDCPDYSLSQQFLQSPLILVAIVHYYSSNSHVYHSSSPSIIRWGSSACIGQWWDIRQRHPLCWFGLCIQRSPHLPDGCPTSRQHAVL